MRMWHGDEKKEKEKKKKRNDEVLHALVQLETE